MKKLILIVCVLLVLGITGVAIFLATFDADRYRPLVVSQLESALGRPVRLERLSLGWRGGIALTFKQLAIYPDAQAQTDPVVQVEAASAVVRLLPLLRKEVQVSSLVLSQPRVHVLRDAQGRINLNFASRNLSTGNHGLARGGMPNSLRQAGSSEARLVKIARPRAGYFYIASVRIEDGALHWTDAMTNPPTDLWVKAVDVTLRNLSPNRPIEFQVRLALFSQTQNLNVRGRLILPTQDEAGLLEGVRVEADLRGVKAAELIRLFPALKDLGIQENLSGELRAVVNRMELDPEALAGLSAQVSLIGGRIALEQFASPIEELTVDALAQAGHIELKNLSAEIAGGTIAVSGTVDHLDTQPRSTFQAKLENVALDALRASAGPHEPQLRGRLFASFQGTAQGLTWSQIAQTLSGGGRMRLINGEVRNLNILREAFARISILPGLVETLQARLPESYRANLAAQDTVLQPIDLEGTASNGELLFPNLEVTTDTFELDGEARVGLDGTLMSQVRLRVDPELSAAIIKSVNELESLTDAGGRLELPVQISGALPRVAVIPDVPSIASRLAMAKTQELLGDLLQKVLKKEEGQ